MSKTILVVDDNVELLNSAAILLQHLGYTVFKAADGPSAMEIVKNQHIDVLFTDFIMPGKIRSVDVANAVKKLHPTTIIIFASGYSIIDKDVIGNASSIEKPYNIIEVHNLIQHELKDLQIQKMGL